MQSKKKKRLAEDSIDIEIVPRSVAAQVMRKKAPSLRPDLTMMMAAAEGQPEAVEIAKAWRFSFPTKVVTTEEFERMAENGVTFGG
jgi:hypothetical protein